MKILMFLLITFSFTVVAFSQSNDDKIQGTWRLEGTNGGIAGGSAAALNPTPAGTIPGATAAKRAFPAAGLRRAVEGPPVVQ